MNSGKANTAEQPSIRRRRKKSLRIKPNKISSTQKALFFPIRLILILLRSSWLPAALLVAYFFVYSSSFAILLDPLGAKQFLLFTKTGGGQLLINPGEEAAEALKSSIGLVFYSFSVLLMLAHWREVLQFTKKNYHVALMLTLPIIGMYISVNPEKVLYSVIQLLAGFFIALAYAISRPGKQISFLNLSLLLLLPISFIHVFSHLLMFIHHIDYAPFIEGSARYGGLAGNPNWLGSSATIGSWLALYVLFDGKSKKLANLLAGICLVLFLLSIVMSGSGTSKATVAVVFCAMLVLRLYLLAKGNTTKVIFVYSLALLLTIGSGLYFVNNSIEDLQLSVVEGLGKESDLTGRTDIWVPGLEAIADNPVFGWGLDNHETVFGYVKYEIPIVGITHYHNGYIDTIVSSGLLVFIFVLYNMGKYVRLFISNFRLNRWSYGMLGPLIILAMHNLSEYSLMRPLNVVYQLYMCAFCLLAVAAYYQQSNDAGVEPKVPVRKRKKSRKGQFRFG